METNLMQAVKTEDLNTEHGYSKSAAVKPGKVKTSAEMSQGGPPPEQQEPSPQPKLVNVKKAEKATPTKKAQLASPLKVNKLEDLTKINPQQYARLLLDEQKRKNASPGTSTALSRLQQQLQNSPPPPIQHNIITSSGGVILQKGIVAAGAGNRKGQRISIQGGSSLLGPRPQLQQGVVQQHVILNNNQPQRFQAVPQAAIPHGQRQMGPNVRIAARPPAQKILPKTVTMPRGQTALLPKQSVLKQGIPANCVQTSTVTIPVQPNAQANAQFQSGSETVLLVSQADGSQVMHAVPHTQPNQLLYTVSKSPSGQPYILKQQHNVVVASPAGGKQRRIIQINNKNQPGIMTPQRQIVTVRPPAPVVNGPNGVNVQTEVLQAVQGNMEEGVGEEEEEEEEEMEEEEEEEPPEGAQNCPTLAEEQRLLSMNQINAGEICRIAIDNGKPFKVLWTGENFVDLSDKQSQAGGGVKKTLEPKNLKGNAVGLHMTRPQEGASASVSGRNWQYSSEGKDLKRQPIRPELVQGQQQQQLGENSTVPQAEAVPVPPSEPGKFAVCKSCGQPSKDYTKCDYCLRPLGPDYKFYYPKGGELDAVKLPVAQKETEEEKGGIEAAQFYAKTTPRILAKRGKGKGRGSKRKKTEPEMVTISSDEEDDGEGDGPGTPVGMTTSLATTLASSVATSVATSMAGIGLPPGGSPAVAPTAVQSLMAAGKGLVVSQPQGASQNPVIQQQLLQQPLSNNPVGNALTRRQRMEDPQGNVIKKPGRKKKRVLTPAQQAKVMEQLAAGAEEEDALPETVFLDARGIRIGSLKGSAYSPVVFTDTGISVNIEFAEESIGDLSISVGDLTKVLYHVGTKMPCIFLQTTQECTNRIRLKCGMTDKNSGPYYDPMSSDESQKLICIILVRLHADEKEKLTCMFEHYDAVTHVKHDLVENVDYNTANVLLATSSGTKHQIYLSGIMPTTEITRGNIKYITVNSISGLQSGLPFLQSSYDFEDSDMEDDEPQDRSPSPSSPISVFAGPMVTLFTYPPPPATGGIKVRNEDLFCLNEGEFLNDVIIDFYLKYLYFNYLNDEDRQRTHIFSSFFYRRLTTKPNMMNEEGKTPQQKRHNRVKTWTRHVDLFKKDFIIVPINESAHWYLAIICFPWMLKPERVPTPPATAKPAAATPSTATPSSDNGENKTESPAAPAEESATSPQPAPAEAQPTEETKMETEVEEPKTENETAGEEAKKEDSQENKEESAPKEEENKSNGDTAETENGQEAAAKSPEENSEKEKNSEAEEGKENSTSQDSEAAKEGSSSAEATTSAGKGAKKVVGNLRQACILVFDSLAGPSRSSVVRTLREYLQIEWDNKKGKTEGMRMFDKDTIRGGNPKCPQQTNYSDCGVYVLQYVESFFQDPIKDYSIPMKALSSWFPEERVMCKRQELRELLVTLKERLNPELEYDCSKDILS